MALNFREGGGYGASIPTVPGTTASMPRPALPQYSTNYLIAARAELDSVRQSSSMALKSQNGTAYVWLGSEKAPHIPKQQYEGRWHDLKSVDELGSEFESKSIKEQKQMARLLYLAGFLNDPDAPLIDVTQAYASLLGEAAMRFASGQNISPDDILEMNIRYNTGNDNFKIKGGKKGSYTDVSNIYLPGDPNAPQEPKTVTRTDKSVDIWNAEDARGLARQTLQQALGRDPTEAEYEDFVTALQTAQRNNPTISKTTTHYDSEGIATSTHTKTTGGLNEHGINELATEQAQSAPDWAEWQAVGTYFPAVMQALGSVVPGV